MQLNKKEILIDYIKFCKDTKANIKSKKSKKDYIKQYLLHAIKFYGVEHIKETQEQLHNILYYNPLTLSKLLEEV